MNQGQPHDAQVPADAGQAIIAHLHGGPFDGAQRMISAAEPNYVERISRGPLRRFLRRPRRYARYELNRSWMQGEFRHGEYNFREVSSAEL